MSCTDNSPPHLPSHFCQWCFEKHVFCIAQSIHALNYGSLPTAGPHVWALSLSQEGWPLFLITVYVCSGVSTFFKHCIYSFNVVGLALSSSCVAKPAEFSTGFTSFWSTNRKKLKQKLNWSTSQMKSITVSTKYILANKWTCTYIALF